MRDRELTDLIATIALYKAEQAARSNLLKLEPLCIFLDPDQLDRIKEAAVTVRGADRRLVLPDVVPWIWVSHAPSLICLGSTLSMALAWTLYPLASIRAMK
jgi:hypothetical protein